MPSIGVFTIASKNYLSNVRVLFDSIARVHPEYKLYLFLADRTDGYFNSRKEKFSIVEAEQLGIPDFDDFTFRYDVLEFNTAIKPFAFHWLFDNTNHDAIIYLDPDIYVYSRFDLLEQVLSSGASVVLTPHITQPVEDGKKPNDLHMLQAGVYNLGFVAATRCKETIDFMFWWRRRLQKQCISDVSLNLFVDQKWCDLAPCFLNHLHILRDPGYNVAYWNLEYRKVMENADGSWVVNGKPLVFYHFSGLIPSDPNVLSKHQDRFELNQLPTLKSLFMKYIKDLRAAGLAQTQKWPFAYGQFEDGTRIHGLMRHAYRKLVDDALIPISNPYRVGPEYICNIPDDGVEQSDTVRITYLMKSVYSLRPDVRAVFLLTSEEGRQRFANWFEIAGKTEYDLPDRVTQQSLIFGGEPPVTRTPEEFVSRWLIALRKLGSVFPGKVPVSLYNKLKRVWMQIYDFTHRIFRKLQ